ncbi:MAG: DUF4276 family protein [bacterium]|nr:DUF4276 family protein [bacterium]
MKQVLDVILPQILSEETSFITIPHQGYGDLRRSVENKLNSWRGDDIRFVIVHDQDNKDCILIKQELEEICKPYRQEVLIRIACQELEAWYFGDLKAVSAAYGRDLSAFVNKKKYRAPDCIRNPKELLRQLIPEHQQISGAKRIASRMDLASNNSKSFNAFISGVRQLEGRSRHSVQKIETQN